MINIDEAKRYCGGSDIPDLVDSMTDGGITVVKRVMKVEQIGLTPDKEHTCSTCSTWQMLPNADELCWYRYYCVISGIVVYYFIIDFYSL